MELFQRFVVYKSCMDLLSTHCLTDDTFPTFCGLQILHRYNPQAFPYGLHLSSLVSSFIPVCGLQITHVFTVFSCGYKTELISSVNVLSSVHSSSYQSDLFIRNA
jgi:hypothetical protein